MLIINYKAVIVVCSETVCLSRELYAHCVLLCISVPAGGRVHLLFFIINDNHNVKNMPLKAF